MNVVEPRRCEVCGEAIEEGEGYCIFDQKLSKVPVEHEYPRAGEQLFVHERCAAEFTAPDGYELDECITAEEPRPPKIGVKKA